MPKVYSVVYVTHDAHEVQGIYSTFDLALNSGFDFTEDSWYSIKEYELDAPDDGWIVRFERPKKVKRKLESLASSDTPTMTQADWQAEDDFNSYDPDKKK